MQTISLNLGHHFNALQKYNEKNAKLMQKKQKLQKNAKIAKMQNNAKMRKIIF